MPAKPFVKITSRGLKEVTAFVRTVPSGAIKSVMAAVAAFLQSSEVLQKYPSYKYVTRAAAYGQQKGGMGFFSAAQRAYVMAAIHSGEMRPGSPNRSGDTAAGWKVSAEPRGFTIVNREAGAYYTAGDPGQSRHEKRVGWLTTTILIAKNMRAVMRVANQALRDFLRTKRVKTDNFAGSLAEDLL